MNFLKYMLTPNTASDFEPINGGLFGTIVMVIIIALMAALIIFGN